jgi:Tol biopolymer transport system component
MLSWASEGAYTADRTYGQATVSIAAAKSDGTGMSSLTSNTVDSAFLDAEAEWSPDGNEVAMVRCPGELFGCDASSDIWLADSSGGHLRKLTSGTDPTWSPDGKTIAFMGSVGTDERALFLIGADGQNRHLLIPATNCSIGRPRWSPDGAWILYFDFCGSGDTHGLYLLSPDGQTKKAITPGEAWYGVSYLGYDWSPDGKRIVFGATGPPPFPTAPDIYVLELATGAYTNLTNTEPDRSKPCCGPDDALKMETKPVYSPDGSEIAFVARSDIWIMNADGSNRRRITNTDWGDDNPSWQPCIKGKTTVCVPPQAGKTKAPPASPAPTPKPTTTKPLRSSANGMLTWEAEGLPIDIARPDGTGVSKLTSNSYVEADWSPDGNDVALDTGSEIWLADSTGGHLHKLTGGTGPTWSPDGKTIAFMEDVAGGTALFLIGADGKNRRQLVPPTECSRGRPRWSPDGAWILYFDFCDPHDNNTHGLYLLSPDGKTKKAITPGQAWFGTSYLGYNWSPDGKRIVFGATGPPPFPTAPDIYVLELGTGGYTNLTNTEPDRNKPCCGYDDALKMETKPVYSPDGREIAFVAGGEIWIMNADGSNRRRITHTHNEWGSDNPTWQPCIKGKTTVCVPPQAAKTKARSKTHR